MFASPREVARLSSEQLVPCSNSLLISSPEFNPSASFYMSNRVVPDGEFQVTRTFGRTINQRSINEHKVSC